MCGPGWVRWKGEVRQLTHTVHKLSFELKADGLQCVDVGQRVYQPWGSAPAFMPAAAVPMLLTEPTDACTPHPLPAAPLHIPGGAHQGRRGAAGSGGAATRSAAAGAVSQGSVSWLCIEMCYALQHRALSGAA